MDQSQAVREAVEAMNVVVAKDGGQVRLAQHDTERDVVKVDFDSGVNEECPGCLITPDMLSAFLLEAIRARGVEVQEVVVA